MLLYWVHVLLVINHLKFSTFLSQPSFSESYNTDSKVADVEKNVLRDHSEILYNDCMRRVFSWGEYLSMSSFLSMISLADSHFRKKQKGITQLMSRIRKNQQEKITVLLNQLL